MKYNYSNILFNKVHQPAICHNAKVGTVLIKKATWLGVAFLFLLFTW